MFDYRIIFILLLLFYACESSVMDNESNSNFEEFNITSFSTTYNNEDNKISIYVEVSDSQNISSLNANISTDDLLIISDIPLLLYPDFNSNIFLYEGIVELSNEIYLYDIDIIVNFNDNTQEIFSDIFSTPIKPEIIDYTIPDTFQLDSFNWTLLPIDIEISNLNGVDNIDLVSYQVQRFYNGCDVACNYDPNCNDLIEDLSYQSDPTWIFEYISSYNLNQNHLYHIDIPMRPLDGSGLLDQDGNNIFSESDCGRTGTVLFKFIVLDEDGLIDEVIDIPMEIID